MAREIEQPGQTQYTCIERVPTESAANVDVAVYGRAFCATFVAQANPLHLVVTPGKSQRKFPQATIAVIQQVAPGILAFAEYEYAHRKSQVSGWPACG
jgi:hypothetical protein